MRLLSTLKNRVLMGSMHSGLEKGSLFGGEVDLSSMGSFFAERAKGGVGLMVTGGVAPNRAGWVAPMAAKLSTAAEMRSHKVVADMVHEAAPDSKLVMQILHSGRYGYHPLAVAPSAVKSPIGWFTPHALTTPEVYKTIDDYANCASLAQEAGYDGVEVMGSEGYLINQFLVNRTNKRDDEWGGAYENRWAKRVARRAKSEERRAKSEERRAKSEERRAKSEERSVQRAACSVQRA